MSNNPYLGKLSPSVGKGLGGLPRRDKVISEAVAEMKKRFVYTADTSSAYTDTLSGSIGVMCYFSDTNIYFCQNDSSTASKTSFNRSTKTVNAINYGAASCSYPSSWGDCNFSIRVSDTMLVSPVNGVKVTRSGDVLTIGRCVPLSGTTTEDSYAYNIANDYSGRIIQVRKKPDNSGYVVVAMKMDPDAYKFVVFITDNNFNIVKSKKFDGENMASSYAFNCFIVGDKLIIARERSETTHSSCYTYLYIINLDTLALLGSCTLANAIAPYGVTINTIYPFGSYYDYDEDYFYTSLACVQSGNFRVATARMRFTGTTFVSDLGVSGTQSLNTVLGITTPYEGGEANIIAHMMQMGDSIDKAYPYMNEYGQRIMSPLSNYMYFAENYSRIVPISTYSFSERLNIWFNDDDFTTMNIYGNTRFNVTRAPSVNRETYNISWTGDPYRGFRQDVSTTPVDIGDNMLLTMQTNTSNTLVYSKLFTRTEIEVAA